MGASLGKLFVELGFKDAGFSSGVSNTKRQLTTLEASGRSFGQAMDAAVTRAVQGAVLALGALSAATVKVGADFEQAITTVGAIASSTDAELAQLEATARGLGASTAFSATEAATAMQDLARAGMTTNEIVGASGPALLLAGSSASSMSEATSLLASTMAQFGLDAAESSRISDVFSTAMRRSLFDMRSLTEAMKYAGTAGAGFGWSLEQTTAAVAMFRNLGLAGSMAGTNLRIALVALANGGDKATAALRKYGLTLDDVNPATHDFAEIMQTLGERGLSTGDALAIFGSRAGANVAQIAQSFADGTTSFYELTGALEDSAGSTQEMYDRMMDTVASQTRIALSALQELMLSVFDTLREPLADLMREVAATISYVAEAFKAEAGGIGATFDSTIRSAVEWLRSNRAELAVTFTGLVQGLAAATKALRAMLPVLQQVGVLMVSVWVAQKVAAVVSALQGVVVSLGTVRGALVALQAQLVAASGGLYALIAGIGTVVALLTAYAAAMTTAEQAAQRLRDAEAELEAMRARAHAAQQARAQELAAQQAANVGAVQLQLEANGELTQGLEQQLEALQQLTDEQVQAGLASGELVTATVNGTEVVLDHATALGLQWEATAAAEDAAKGLRLATNHNVEAQRANAREIERLEGLLAEYNAQVARGVREAVAFGGALAQEGSSLEVVQAKLEGLYERQATLTTQQQGLEQGRARALQELELAEKRRERAARNASDADRDAAEAARERKRAEQELERAINARVGLVEQAEAKLAGLRADDAEQAALAYEQELDALQEVFAAEYRAAEALGQDTTALRAEQARAELVLWKGYQQQLTNMEAEDASKRAEQERAARQRVAEQVAQLVAEDARQRATTTQAIELERLAALEAAEGATAEQIAQINAVYDRRQADHRDATRQRVLQIVDSEAAEVLRITQKRDELLAEAEDLSASERRKVWRAYQREIDDATTTGGEKMVAALRKAADAAVELARAAVNAIKGLGGAIADVLQGITGFSFDLFDAVADVTDTMQEAADLQEQLASGEITQAEYDEAVADLPATAQEAAAAFVQELVDGVLTAIQTFVDAAPTMVAELAAAIPTMVQALVDALPGIVQSLIAELPALVDALIAAVEQLVQTVADLLPGLVQALVDEIPKLIDSVGEVTPVIIDTVVQAVGVILDAIPSIVDQLLAQLPTIIQAVVGAIQDLIGMLVDMIPELLAVIVEQLPTIVRAVVDGILGLVGTIITEIIGELIPAIIGMIPQIIGSILEAVIQIVQGVVDALPMLIKALLEAVGQIIGAIIDMIPMLLTTIVELLPELIGAILELIPAIIEGLVEGIPLLLEGIIGAIPELIRALIFELTPALIGSIPELIYALVAWIPDLVSYLWTEVIGGLVDFVESAWEFVTEGLGDFVSNLWDQIMQGIKDFAAALWDEISGWVGDLFGGGGGDGEDKGFLGSNTWFGDDDTKFWSDTPSVQRMANTGIVGLTGGDFYAAAQSPTELLRQALAGVGIQPARVSMTGTDALAVAVLQAADALTQASKATGTDGGGGSWRVTLEADGKVLDSVLYTSGKRGRTRQLDKRLRKTAQQAGVHPGFDRGKK